MSAVASRQQRWIFRACLLLVILVRLAASASQKSDPLCPHIVACEYEAPAFTIRVVDQQTGQPLADVHAIATWLVYGFHGRRGILMALEAVSGPDGQLSFPAWGPLPSTTEGMIDGRDPVITIFRPGHAPRLVYNATPPAQAGTVRAHPFQQAGVTFELALSKGGASEEVVKELWEAAAPVDGGEVSRQDSESIRKAYVNRWRRIRAEAEKLPAGPDVSHLLWQLDSTIRAFSVGGGQ